MKYSKPARIFQNYYQSTLLQYKQDQHTIINSTYPKLEPRIMDFNLQNTNLPKLGMKYKLKLVTNLTLVIGQKIGSKNPLKILLQQWW